MPTTTADTEAVPPAKQNPRRFYLHRAHDTTGVSGTGRIADGIEWPDGTVTIRWRGDRPSVVHWAALADAEHVHGHGGRTYVVWLDLEQSTQGARERAEAERDGAYRERAHLLAWLAALHPAVRTLAPDTAEPGWQILYLNPVTGGQMSWHIAPRDVELFDHVEYVPAGSGDQRALWDGHTTEAKYERIAALTADLAQRCGSECDEGHTYAGRCEAAVTTTTTGEN
ncbi:hypothetical protein V2S66_03180 [Streptomyces sp. V4-01]|uniref:Uncharacterized protein n=1 Tax=Actinacidiphila polyblastidii TaxID=3110430 RepID=A0ABU7P583_9ACTN|nr:hypothetical protein [Streptomyces sp. V4-01]